MLAPGAVLLAMASYMKAVAAATSAVASEMSNGHTHALGPAVYPPSALNLSSAYVPPRVGGVTPYAEEGGGAAWGGEEDKRAVWDLREAEVCGFRVWGLGFRL